MRQEGISKQNVAHKQHCKYLILTESFRYELWLQLSIHPTYNSAVYMKVRRRRLLITVICSEEAIVQITETLLRKLRFTSQRLY
jgi:hypothetical protein